MWKLMGTAVVLLAGSVALACDGHATNTTAAVNSPKASTTLASADVKAPVSIAKISVDELQAMIDAKAQKKQALTVVDCNSPETRASKGLVVGAVLFNSKEPLASLPKDKGEPVVFYCSSEQCSASEKAAGTAVEAGYTQVKVLPVGIAGWVKANKKTDKPVG
jgi:rhodanese-related sulfurtransferase